MFEYILWAGGFLLYLISFGLLVFFSLRWVSRKIESEKLRHFFITVSVIVAVCFALVSSGPFVLPLSMMISPINWNTGKHYKIEKSKPRTPYTEECERVVSENLRCPPNSPNYDIGYYVNGKPIPSTGKEIQELELLYKRVHVTCGNGNFSLKENSIPEEFFNTPYPMALDPNMDGDRRLYPTCYYSFICESKKNGAQWDTKLISGKLDKFAFNPLRKTQDVFWIPDEWEDTLPVSQALCRKLLYDVNKANEELEKKRKRTIK